MPEMKRVLVDIDGTEISAIEAHYVVSRASNQFGQRVANSMRARAYFYADIRETSTNGPDKVVSLWKIATETSDPLHSVTITFYKNDTDELVVVKFKGWISIFEVWNPAVSTGESGNAGMGGTGGPSLNSLTQYGNVLFCELGVVLDDENLSNHRLSK
jgi:hypothetical protein